MKNENNDYVNKITRKMVSSLSQIVEIQEYNLDDLTILIRDLKETEKEKIIEEIINNQLIELKEKTEKKETDCSSLRCIMRWSLWCWWRACWNELCKTACGADL